MIVGVIGSGSIGPDLAYGFLSAVARKPGAKVYLVDIKQEALDAGTERIRGYAKKGVARGKLSPKAAKAIDDALTPTMNMADLADCDYVLEAASEDLAIKRHILADLEKVVKPDCLVGFATSGIPRAQIAAIAGSLFVKFHGNGPTFTLRNRGRRTRVRPRGSRRHRGRPWHLHQAREPKHAGIWCGFAGDARRASSIPGTRITVQRMNSSRWRRATPRRIVPAPIAVAKVKHQLAGMRSRNVAVPIGLAMVPASAVSSRR